MSSSIISHLIYFEMGFASEHEARYFSWIGYPVTTRYLFVSISHGVRGVHGHSQLLLGPGDQNISLLVFSASTVPTMPSLKFSIYVFINLLIIFLFIHFTSWLQILFFPVSLLTWLFFSSLSPSPLRRVRPPHDHQPTLAPQVTVWSGTSSPTEAR